MDTAGKHRVLLSLRSEKAMGLRSIPKSLNDGPIREIEDRVEPKTVTMAAPRRIIPQAVEKSRAVAASLPTANLLTTTPMMAELLPTDQKRSRLIAMAEKEVRVCTKCKLCTTRTQTVFGEGDVDAKIMFVGEGPGENEDKTGRPFVGRAGQLLDKMIIAMGLQREQVYIANIVKCRPPQNRVPAPDEVATCTPYLERQIEIIRPTVLVTLGRPAVSYMLGNPKLTMGSVRGRWHEWRGIKLMPTFHPSYVLRTYTEEVRKAVWGDLKLVMAEIGM